MDVYGTTGYAKAMDSERIEVRLKNEERGEIRNGAKLRAPDDDPIHYMAALLAGEVQEGDSMSSLKTNVMVTEILDAARRSAETGRTVTLPLR